MEILHSALLNAIGDLNLARDSKDLLLATLAEGGKTIAPYHALELLRLVDTLRVGKFPRLIPLQKTQLLENLVNLIRQNHREWVSRICYIFYEETLPPKDASYPLPEGMIRDLIKWVNVEKAQKVREILWAILLRKETGLAAFAKVADVTAGLCEKDPITRNNVIRFLFDHFNPEAVVDSLFEYSMASGKRVPGVVFKRYVSLLKDQEDLQQKKCILERILSTANLDGKEIDLLFSDYMNSLNRFDLIRLLSSSDGSSPRIADLKREGMQKGFFLNYQRTVSSLHGSFGERISRVMQA
jgi:hypothetical protein